MNARAEFMLRPSRIRRRLAELELAASVAIFGLLLWRQPLCWWLAPAALAWFAASFVRLGEPVRLLIRSAEGWWLREGGGPALAIRIAPGSWFGPGLAILRLLPERGGRTRLLPVWPDNLADDERRRLHRALTAES